MEQKNKNYEYWISDTPIIESINSINKYSYYFWTNTFSKTFKKVDLNVNFISDTQVSTILDKNNYSVLKIVDNQQQVEYKKIRYFFNSNVTKRLTSGYECIFDLDIYHSFLEPFFSQNLTYPILVNRSFDLDIIKDNYVDNNFLVKDELLDFSNSDNVILTEKGTPASYDFAGRKLSEFKIKLPIKTGYLVRKSAWTDQLTGYGEYPVDYGKNIDGTVVKLTECPHIKSDWEPNELINIDFHTPLAWVFKSDNNQYLILFELSTSWEMKSSLYVDNDKHLVYYTAGNDKTYIPIDIESTYISINVNFLKNDYWKNRLVGCFYAPWFNKITNYYFFDTSPDTLEKADCIIGSVVERNDFMELVDLTNLDESRFFDYKESISFGGIFDCNEKQVSKSTKPNGDENERIQNRQLLSFKKYDDFYDDTYFLLENNNEFQYFYNYKDNSQSKYSFYLASNIQIDNYLFNVNIFENSLYSNGKIYFDGNNFTILKGGKKINNIGWTTYGTINTSLSGYEQFLSTTKSQLSTSLEIAKQNRDLQLQQVNLSNNQSIFSSGLGLINNLVSGNFSGALSTIGNFGFGLSKSNLQTQSINNAYQNTLKSQDAMLQDKRRSLTSIDFSPSFSSDGYKSVLLRDVKTNFGFAELETGNKSYTFNVYNTYLARLPINKFDVAKFKNLIANRGIKIDRYYKFSDVFNKFKDESIVSDFGRVSYMYYDLSISDELIDFVFNVENQHIKNLIKQVINNSFRVIYDFASLYNSIFWKKIWDFSREKK